ncbi:type II toxin-antitoxin system VapC family toxin [Moraxella boevrei]|uniref:type II toxin-antitoxin system VapC family toxin n=1 Tax=Faucicola boevrei TaxID=346665 RepID=UPI0037360E4F
MTKLLIDTDVMIELTRGNNQAIQLLNTYQKQHQLCVSSINRYELLIGSRNKSELKDLLELLTFFNTLSLNNEIAQMAEKLIIDYNLSHNLQLADALIASTALVNDVGLLSRNKKDFQYTDKINLISYPNS